jgi:Holliday junction resolvase RusA-like endonuclease
MAAQVSPVTATHPGAFPSVSAVGEAVSLTFYIAGKPVPKGRPRGRAVMKAGGKPWVQFYSDPATVDWEKYVSRRVLDQLDELAARDDDIAIALPFTERCLVTLRFNLAKPKSTPKAQFPVKSRTDVDNLAKAVLDSLQNAGLIANDNIITDLTVSKRYADEDHPEGVEIDITALGASM